MRVLALDTATPDLVTGVVDIASGELTEKVIEDTRLLSEQLMPAVEEVIAKQQRGYAAIDAIAVGVGPGPFTGLRVAWLPPPRWGKLYPFPSTVCAHMTPSRTSWPVALMALRRRWELPMRAARKSTSASTTWPMARLSASAIPMSCAPRNFRHMMSMLSPSRNTSWSGCRRHFTPCTLSIYRRVFTV